MKEPGYTYRATVVRVYDGDTITVDIDLGFGVILSSQVIRLLGVNTPEVRGPERPEGLRVRDEVRELIPIGSEIVIRTSKDRKGKYGRWLAEVFFQGGRSLNDILIENGHTYD